ncbi:PD40 domain-containing protein [bacterium]|nr:PD40 domain-containing protein [bacterium]
MISKRYLPFILVVGLVASGCSKETGVDYTGREFIATPFTQVNSDQGESWITMNTDETRIVFSRHSEGWTDFVLYETMLGEGGWTEAAPMPFSGTYNDRAARFYPALDAMLFTSDRPVSADDKAGDFNLWTAMHDGEEWIAPEPLTALNTDANDFHGSVAADGSIYFASDREGGQGKSDLYHAVLGREGYVVTPVQGAVNTEYSESDVYIDQESRFMIFSRTDDPAGFGGDDLWISFPSETGWSEAVNLGPEVNTADYEYGATVAMDEVNLFFTSHKNGQADIFRTFMNKLVVDWPVN